ncbi:hypothetical protein H920_04726 [Fukomys damarensis]|uniref:Uncharacterized protein n=1 Tax=Fukomys damarensis TaxID=885580 RepID=A0A091DRP3_FUKDA|nr:hypothetical protein H920_04726 [Fukomys damarensis]
MTALALMAWGWLGASLPLPQASLQLWTFHLAQSGGQQGHKNKLTDSFARITF